MTRVGRKGGRKDIRGRIDNKEKRIGQTKKRVQNVRGKQKGENGEGGH